MQGEIGTSFLCPKKVDNHLNGMSLNLETAASASLIRTHGFSALPYYLLSCADRKKFESNSELKQWAYDLVVSSLLLCSLADLKYSMPNEMFGRESIRPEINLLGTLPSNVRTIINLFIYPFQKTLIWDYEDGLVHGIVDVSKVSELILRGYALVYEDLSEFGVNKADIQNYLRISDYGGQYGKSHLSQTLPGIRQMISSYKERKKNHTLRRTKPDSTKYLLTNRFGIATLYRARTSVTLLAVSDSEYMKPADSGHYSWGYYGTGCINLARTILEDYFTHEDVNRDHELVFIYNIISVLSVDDEYSISGYQIESSISLLEGVTIKQSELMY